MFRRTAIVLFICVVLSPSAFSRGVEGNYTINGRPILAAFSRWWSPDLVREALAGDVNLIYAWGHWGVGMLDVNSEMGKLIRDRGAKILAGITNCISGELAENLDDEETEIVLKNFSLIAQGPGTVWIDDEAIRFARVETVTYKQGRKRERISILVDCKRGWAGTKAATHALHKRTVYVVWEEQVRGLVRRRMHSPNLWGYWVTDDLKPAQRDALRRVYKIIKDADAAHVVVAGMDATERVATVPNGVCDMVAIRVDPCRGVYEGDLTGKQLKAISPSLRRRNIPFMGIIQGYYSGDPTFARPTPETIREQAADYVKYGASALGVSGWWYPRPGKGTVEMADVLDEISAIGKDLRTGKIDTRHP